MKLIVGLLFCLVISITNIANAIASSQNTAVTGATLKIVMGEDTYPFQYFDENQQPAGILVDLWREWALVTNTKVEFHIQNWQQSLNRLQSGDVDIHIGMVPNASRQAMFDFSNPITSLETYLFIHKSIGKKHQLTDLIPYQIGIVEGSSHEQSLLAINPNFNFRKYSGRDALLIGAMNGEVLVFAGIEGYQRDMTLEQNIANDYYSSTRLPIEKVTLVAAVKKGNASLLNRINQGFQKVDPEQIKRIERRWLGYNRQNDGLLIAMQSDVEPFVDIGSDGLPRGLFVDLWKLWSSKSGISIDFVVGDMNSSIADIKRGFADVHIGYPESNEMNTGLKQAWHITSVKSRFFSIKKNITDLNLLGNIRIGVFPTAPYISEIHALYPNAQLRFYESTDLMVDAALKGEIIGFIASSATTSHYLLGNKLWADFTQYFNIEFFTDIYSLIRMEDSGLEERIRAGFELISPEERLQIERKWLINPDDRYFSGQNQKIILSSQDRTYLASLGAIKMGYIKDWRPMEFQGKNGEFLGVNSDVKSLLVNQLGVSIIPIAFDTFEQMMQQLRSGEIQLVASLAYNHERDNSVLFSEPYWPSPWAVASDLTQPPIFNINQLDNKVIAVIEGYQLIEQFRQQYPEIKLMLVPDTRSGLNAVINGHADMFIEKVTSLADVLKNGDFPSLKLSLLADLADEQSRIGIFSGLEELMPLINRVISTVDKTAQQHLYRKWNDVKLNTDDRFYQRWMNSLIIGLLVISVITVTVLVVNRRLKVEIQRRENAEDKLVFLANHDSVTGLANRTLLDEQLIVEIEIHQKTKSKFALLFIDLDGFKIVNDAHGHAIGDILLAQVAEVFKSIIKDTDSVARFGGDEFVIIINQLETVDQAKKVANTLLSKLAKIDNVEGKSIQISASIGIAVYPHDGVTAEELMKHSDSLMYQAKRVGGHQHRINH
ncbi:transporter substrate-binding domain-containing protein [Shewanella sp. OMA3-2]|uniref:transporter substrate-binding domain-containing protein n=1 Tax=Shewanella sp. OMA3-2 TaxID=2908650 RepID=UPI001F18CD28|nr:transporter substrate-binding domain-containing protein [Shewanella sp. OMA3-2]UJF20759.1 transporter substrate-binding domain-containing protein [Shewanella sp. OMA3-2]